MQTTTNLERNQFYLLKAEKNTIPFWTDQLPEGYNNCSYSALRLFMLFNDLLANQFLIQNIQHPIKLRHPADFASALLIHVNHLNRTLKTVTGKTTSALIAEKLIEESRMLLKHTNYTCSEIAWCLGFDGLPNFIHFFKRNAGATPNSFRKMYAVKD